MATAILIEVPKQYKGLFEGPITVSMAQNIPFLDGYPKTNHGSPLFSLSR